MFIGHFGLTWMAWIERLRHPAGLAPGAAPVPSGPP
jgi:hypothetical protein